MDDRARLHEALSAVHASLEPLHRELEARGWTWTLLTSARAVGDFGHVELSRPSQPEFDRLLWAAIEIRTVPGGLEVDVDVEEWLDAEDQSDGLESRETARIVGPLDAQFLAELATWVRGALLRQLSS